MNEGVQQAETRAGWFLQQTGEALQLLWQALLWCRACHRNLDKVVRLIAEIGNATLPITALVSIFIGGVLALQTGTELAKFGIESSIGGIVGLSMVRELGPVMTAILLAGRVGSAMAAEIGAMSVYQEIDALKTMNIDPVRYLVMPRLIATVVSLPLLVIYADIIGWMGGAVVARTNPKMGIPFHAYFRNLTETVEAGDLLNGLIKSLVFAFLIATICTYVGLTTTGGPEEIGKSVTKAVVLSFIFIMVFDYIMTRLLM